MSLSAMTFHESYGHLPKSTLTLIRKHNVSPLDYDLILNACGHSWGDEDIPFSTVNELITIHSSSGILRLPTYM